MKYLVYDIETTGVPERISFDQYYKEIDKYESSRLIQIAWQLFDENNEQISKFEAIIKPDVFTVPDKMISGITHKYAIEHGIPINVIFEKMNEILPSVDIIVGHNIKFDKYCTLAELYRYDNQDIIDMFENKDFFCTCENTKNICKIKNGKWFKNPSLIEAYEKLIGGTIKDKQHTAMVDVETCSKIYQKLISQKCKSNDYEEI